MHRVVRAIPSAISLLSAPLLSSLSIQQQSDSHATTTATFSIPTSEAKPKLEGEYIVDHLSSQKFELHRTIPSLTAVSKAAQRPLHTLGCNTRCMLGWCWVPIARAYAFGVYIDDDAIVWGKARASTGDAAVDLKDLLDEKQRNPAAFEIAIVLKMAREIAGEHLAHGFRNSVMARLPVQGGSPRPVDRTAALQTGKAAAAYGSSGVAAASASAAASMPTPSSSLDDVEPAIAQLSRFTSTYAGKVFAPGEEITFVWARDGNLYTAFKGELIHSKGTAVNATITDPTIIRALYDVYLSDKNPVSRTGLKTVKQNWRDVLQDPAVVQTVSSRLSEGKPTAAPVSPAPVDEADVLATVRQALRKLRAKLTNEAELNTILDESVAKLVPPKPAISPDAISTIVMKEHATRR